jgi:Family of unknown function (DUF6931)
MADTTTTVESERRASEVSADIDLSEEARSVLNTDMTWRQYVVVLGEHSHYLDAIKVLARGLPKQAAVQWGLRCVREAPGAGVADADVCCLEAAEAWVNEPSEQTLLAAKEAAEAKGYDSAAAWLAAAAGWAGGSLAPASVPVVPPPEHLTALAVAGAIGLAAAAVPEDVEERQRRFLELGREASR